ncbi:MAG TPA: hypothetical protein VHG28_08815 [Longimicrobiaceae bacterium]|nr:hypothetical protein [Longimicrobiaceae bacterium]
MVALILCAGAFLACFFAGKRSLVAGLTALLAVGYFYGIARANVTSALSHFIFDAGVLGLYATRLFRPLPLEERMRIQPIVPWLALLIGWPVVLLLLPLQDPMIQLVGLRAHIFLLPFLLLGARLCRDDVDRLAISLAVLNLVVFGIAVMEFFVGIESFYPRNEVTDIIYKSNDIHTGNILGAYRIPATFAHAGLYGGTMVITLPFLLGGWTQRQTLPWRHRQIIMAGLVATVLGVFLSASRMHFMVLTVLVMVSVFGGRLGMAGRVGWVFVLAGLGWLVSMEERLFQRILSLNTDTILERLSWGVNQSFVELMFRYPLGNGLGGGGSSIPYFLRSLVRDPIWIENHYATIMLEQGLPGLLIWVAFLFWVFLRRTTRRDDPWYLGRRLAWFAAGAYFAQGLIGVGLLTAVPFTILLLLCVGWISVRQPGASVGSTPGVVPSDHARTPVHSYA